MRGIRRGEDSLIPGESPIDYVVINPRMMPSFPVTIAFVMAMHFSQPAFADENHVILVERATSVPQGTPTKLSPALSVTKYGGGELKGADDFGQPVIALSTDGLERVKTKQTVAKELPAAWKPITRLQVGYALNDPPTAVELDTMGVRVVDNYAKGSFMLVEPVDGKITAALLEKLENSPKILHINPSLRIKAVQK